MDSDKKKSRNEMALYPVHETGVTKEQSMAKSLTKSMSILEAKVSR